MDTRKEATRTVITSISELIILSLHEKTHEQYFPSANPDVMDANIINASERVEKLRKIREAFEDAVTNVVATKF